MSIKEFKRRLSVALHVLRGRPTGYRLVVAGLDASYVEHTLLVECKVTSAIGGTVAELRKAAGLNDE